MNQISEQVHSFPWLKFGHEAYLFGEFRAKANIFARCAFFELYCHAIKQHPVCSIPNDDDVLAGWIKITVAQWLKVKDLVLSQFSLGDDGRYYCDMLIDLYTDSGDEAPNGNDESSSQKESKTRSSSAERMQRKREREAAEREAREREALKNKECDAAVTPNSVTNEGVGGDLDLDKKLDLDLKKELNSHSKTREAEKNSRRFFDDELRPDLNLLNAKLGANLVTQKFIDENLFLFNAHYETHQITDNQRLAKWIAWWKGEQAKQQAQTIQRPSKTQPPKNTKQVFGNVNDSFPINPDDRLLTQAEKDAIAKSLEEDEHVVF